MNLKLLVDLSRLDYKSFFELLIRFSFNIITLIIIVRWLYYPITKRKDYLFTFIILGTIIFLLCFLLASVQLQIGFALGLFAVFGIIRYRTDAIPIKEMTYLFIVIGISVINALFNDSLKVIELIFTNIVVIVLIYCLERVWFLKNERSKIIIYEKIDLIKPENHALLLEDLKNRTGIHISRVEIGQIDFLRDTAQIKIYFIETGQSLHFSNENDPWKGGEN